MPEEWKELRPPTRPGIEDYFALWDGNPPEKVRARLEEMFATYSTAGILEWDVKDPETKELIEFMA